MSHTHTHTHRYVSSKYMGRAGVNVGRTRQPAALNAAFKVTQSHQKLLVATEHDETSNRNCEGKTEKMKFSL